MLDGLNLLTEPPTKVLLEDLLQSKGRIKILKILALQGELNISGIAKQASLNHTSVSGHLKYLTKAGIIQEKIFGRIRVYRLRTEDARVQRLRTLLQTWDQPDPL